MNEPTTVTINSRTLELVQGNIVNEAVDAIVNAANTSLLGGGGVDGAIHRAAGPRLLAETLTMGGCAVGDAKISGGYNLAAKHVIHTVGPVYVRDKPEVPAQLASAYRRSLEVAAENQLQTVAFPAISTGVYGYPLDEAAQIALDTVYTFLKEGKTQHNIALVRFVLYTSDVFEAFARALRGKYE
jgi:O-acetyl-ADP-ribose deacetylase